MQITKELIEALLWEEESTTLDFKRDQYPFVTATNDEKSELLKDILAFTNAFRRNDAFILVGVEEVNGGRSKVVGVKTQLNDADLQQFINSKTQRPVQFSYRAAVHDGLPIAIIHIPQQFRPVYNVKDFGKLKEQVVYLRRGSSTDRAKPEEVARMGADQVAIHAAEPTLEVLLFDHLTRKVLGPDATFNTLNLQVPDEDSIPDYVEGQGSDVFAVPQLMHINRHYFRELVNYTWMRCFLRPLSFVVRNSSAVSAQDVRLILEIDVPADDFLFMEEHELDEPPTTRNDFLVPSIPGHIGPSDIDVEKTPNGWRIECGFGKVQPKDSVRLGGDVYVGAYQSGTLTIKGKLFADNLSEPATTQHDLHFSVASRVATLEGIEKLEYERFAQTPDGKKALGESDDDSESAAGT